jgi:hypothetical protein
LRQFERFRMAETNQHEHKNVYITSCNGGNKFQVSIPLHVACKFQVINTMINDLGNDIDSIPIPESYKFKNQEELETFFKIVEEVSKNVNKDIDLNKYINNDKNKTVRFINLIHYLDYDILYKQFLNYIVKFIMKE